MGGARPRFGPVPGAVFARPDPPPHVVIRAMAAELERREIPLARVAPEEGYLESTWFDVASHRAVAPPFGAVEGVVKLRVFADPVGRNTRLFVEAVRRVAWDPSVPERELERMVGEDHPVRRMLNELIDGLGAGAAPGRP